MLWDIVSPGMFERKHNYLAGLSISSYPAVESVVEIRQTYL